MSYVSLPLLDGLTQKNCRKNWKECAKMSACRPSAEYLNTLNFSAASKLFLKAPLKRDKCEGGGLLVFISLAECLTLHTPYMFDLGKNRKQ